jgi:hypothetical protein
MPFSHEVRTSSNSMVYCEGMKCDADVDSMLEHTYMYMYNTEAHQIDPLFLF